jgi:hypothetical protein
MSKSVTTIADMIANDRGLGVITPSNRGTGFDITYPDGSVDWAIDQTAATICAQPFNPNAFRDLPAATQRRILTGRW